MSQISMDSIVTIVIYYNFVFSKLTRTNSVFLYPKRNIRDISPSRNVFLEHRYTQLKTSNVQANRKRIATLIYTHKLRYTSKIQMTAKNFFEYHKKADSKKLNFIP